jgi:hypothetical protein
VNIHCVSLSLVRSSLIGWISVDVTLDVDVGAPVVNDLVGLAESSPDLVHDGDVMVRLNVFESEIFGHTEVMPAARRRVYATHAAGHLRFVPEVSKDLFDNLLDQAHLGLLADLVDASAHAHA